MTGDAFSLCLTERHNTGYNIHINSYIYFRTYLPKGSDFLAELKPFAALRYDIGKAGEIERLVCPPYDVISEDEQKKLLAASPYNAVNLELPYGENPYTAAQQTLNKWIEDGILKQDMDEGIYICEDEFTDINGETKTRRGIICRVKLEDPENRVVLPHESTLTDARADRLAMLNSLACNTSPVFALYSDKSGITGRRITLLAKTCAPRYNFNDGEVSHRLWVINDPIAINAVCEDFAERKLLIADGHHRYAAALEHRDLIRQSGRLLTNAEYIMMYLTDIEDSGLVVYPTHRLLGKNISINSDELLRRCGENFDICENPDTAQCGCDLVFYNGSVKFGLNVKTPCKTAVEALDESVFKDILNISPNSDDISYTHSAEKAVAAVDSGEYACCFIVRRTTTKEITAAAENGLKLPQKSTYFYPKPLTGLAMYKTE